MKAIMFGPNKKLKKAHNKAIQLTLPALRLVRAADFYVMAKIMNKLVIKIIKSSSDSFKSFNEVKLFIDGVNLIDILKEIEKPFAEKENHPEIAGHYIGLNLQFLNKNYFLGSDSSYGKNQNKTALLDCPCGCEGCWTLAAKISELENTILWSDFEQIHRNGEITDDVWDYKNIKFEFDKNQYFKELEKIKT